MRVLHLPDNIASQIFASVKALNSIGVEARGLVVNPSIIQEAGNISVIFHKNSIWKKIKAIYPVFSAIYWADVLHWHFGITALPKLIDLYWAKLLNKPGVVEYWGSDIRIAEIESLDNPYYKRARDQGQFNLPDNRQASIKRQETFAAAGYDCVVADWTLTQHLNPTLYNKVHVVPQRIIVSDYYPHFPDPDKKRIIIAHSPSRPLEKGTPAVVETIEKLRDKYDIDFWFITGMKRQKALELVAQCDIFVDQLIAGTHGLAALEAMALGKPVICYLKPFAVENHPADLPIVNATVDNLQVVLESLLRNGEMRYSLGCQGRAYVEKYHDAEKIAIQLVDIYQQVIQSRG